MSSTMSHTQPCGTGRVRSVTPTLLSSPPSPSGVLSSSPYSSPTQRQHHFLPVDPTVGDGLVRAHHDRATQKRTGREERRSSIFKSLAILDVDENDDDYTTGYNQNKSTNSSYANRNNHNNNSHNNNHNTRDGSRNDATRRNGNEMVVVSAGEGPITPEYPPPTTPVVVVEPVVADIPPRSRYLRRGSVTKHRMEANMTGLQPTGRGGADRDNDREGDDGDDRTSGRQRQQDQDQQQDQQQQRRYLRRGSVTKYSLDSSVGAGMQPTDVANDVETMGALKGNHKYRLPPPPSNDSYTRFDWKYTEDDKDDDENDENDDENDNDNAKKEPDPVDRHNHQHLYKHPPPTEPSKPSSFTRRASMPPVGTATPKGKKVRPSRPTRRGSMKMPDSYEPPPPPGPPLPVPTRNTKGKRLPLPGDDLYSGNLDDSGHHQRNLYFDPENVILVVNPDESNGLGHEVVDDADAAAGGMSTIEVADWRYLPTQSQTLSASRSLLPLEDDSGHEITPLFVRKTTSGRNLLVDESDQYRNEQLERNYDRDDDDDDDAIGGGGGRRMLQTIGTTGMYPSNIGMSHPPQVHRPLQRAGSSSSFESDSDSEFGSDRMTGGPTPGQGVGRVNTAKHPPRLPPTHSTAASSSTASVSQSQSSSSQQPSSIVPPKKKLSLPGRRRDGYKDKPQGKHGAKKNDKEANPSDHQTSPVPGGDTDSTTSSTRSEEEDSVILAVAKDSSSSSSSKAAAAVPVHQSPSARATTSRTATHVKDAPKKGTLGTNPGQSITKTPVRKSSLSKGSNHSHGEGKNGPRPPLGGAGKSSRGITATATTNKNRIVKACKRITNGQKRGGDSKPASTGSSVSAPVSAPASASASASASLPTSSSSSASSKRVRFGRIYITEFPIILGDNPAVTSGAPITIDWIPQGETSYSVNAYEQCKPARRRRRKLLISVSSRAILLLAAGYSIDDIADASINAQQIKVSRRDSMHATQRNWDRVSLLMENTNDALSGMMQNTGKKLKSLIIAKPVQHSETARSA